MSESTNIGQAAVNTDRELFREPATDWVGEGYMPKVFVTAENAIGMQVGGLVLVRSITDWHRAGQIADAVAEHTCLDCGHQWVSHEQPPHAEGFLAVPLCRWPGCHCHQPVRALRRLAAEAGITVDAHTEES